MKSRWSNYGARGWGVVGFGIMERYLTRGGRWLRQEPPPNQTPPRPGPGFDKTITNLRAERASAAEVRRGFHWILCTGPLSPVEDLARWPEPNAGVRWACAWKHIWLLIFLPARRSSRGHRGRKRRRGSFCIKTKRTSPQRSSKPESSEEGIGIENEALRPRPAPVIEVLAEARAKNRTMLHRSTQ